ncbi:MAG: heme lyase CcmF/NrfE family subunit [Chloroflexi bacterium]|nr:heme lyase CcmF/NrfE family subunit [Chloroflexota bacterium]
MAEIGNAALLIALVTAAYVAVIGIVGARRHYPELVTSARNGLIVVAGLVTVAAGALALAFLIHDFNILYVAENSNRAMPWYYVLAAFWGGQPGSLLFWAWMLTLFAALAVQLNWRSYRDLMPYVMAVLMGIEVFFLALLNFISNPFERLWQTSAGEVTAALFQPVGFFPYLPGDGQGLNPLLWDRGMMVHPPMLLMGYMSVSIPYAFAMAALLTGKLDLSWLKATRRWTLTAWGLLTIGNLLGAWWAYHVLGWGGYWGWDPVENVALMPWLAASAYLHSVIMQEKRGMLKVWNFALIILTFNLSIFGTFVVRSGVISSVHSFAQSSLGALFFAFLGVAVLFSLGALFSRLSLLRDERHLDGLLSRESGFLYNNLLLVGVVVATFLGVIFPILTEAVRNEKISVGPPYYQQVNGPLLLALMALMGIGPLLPWRRASLPALSRAFRWPLAALAVTLIGLLAGGVRSLGPLAGFAVATFVLATHLQEFYTGVRAREQATSEPPLTALVNLITRNRQRYGGYLVHLGLVMVMIGVVASSFFQISKAFTLWPGQTVNVGRYALTYDNLYQRREPGKNITFARLFIAKDGHDLGEIQPGKAFYPNYDNQPASEIVIRTTLLEDLYVVLNSWADDGTATFYIFINPMVAWLWLGGATLVCGGFIAWWPFRAAAPARAFRTATEGLTSEA